MVCIDIRPLRKKVKIMGRGHASRERWREKYGELKFCIVSPRNKANRSELVWFPGLSTGTRPHAHSKGFSSKRRTQGQGDQLSFVVVTLRSVCRGDCERNFSETNRVYYAIVPIILRRAPGPNLIEIARLLLRKHRHDKWCPRGQ